ncbi:hypothetical protein PoB_000006600 [Plakobranchus ocellatus]|uniref:G-protein coupled receptors family 1 profile domain-containing protein n=1 Tax=Plakobranchus ocellatus TaxID=259542 RepID=A0AAV3XQF1_9GAST|nr:hypothetical protein PoB_000006600 [Plakobranchus ocellatus]
MFFNVSHLLTSNGSRDTLSSMLITQHTVLLPLNLLSALLNATAVWVVFRSKAALGSMFSALLLGLSFVNMLCGCASFLIDLLYFTTNIDCSGNCELTFNLEADSSPGVLVTLLRYASDVCRSAHYSQVLLSVFHYWLLFTKPLHKEYISRRRFIIAGRLLVLVVSVGGNLYVLVDGLALHSDAMYYRGRTYVLPLVHTLHSIVLFCLYYRLAKIVIHQIGEVAKYEQIQSRFHPADPSLKHRRSQNKKNLYIVKLIILVYGTFMVTMSPSIFFRAFRPRLPSNFSTLRTLLILDVLPPTHFLVNFFLIASTNKLFQRVVKDRFSSIASGRGCCTCPDYGEPSRDCSELSSKNAPQNIKNDGTFSPENSLTKLPSFVEYVCCHAYSRPSEQFSLSSM